MNGLSIENLSNIQAKTSAANTKNTMGSNNFAQLMAAQMESQAAQSSTTSLSSYNAFKTYQAMQTESTATTANTAKDSDNSLTDNKNLLLLLCFMMMSNSSGDDTGMSSSMMMSMLMSLGGDSSAESNSLSQYALTNNLSALTNVSSGTQSQAMGSAITQYAMTRLGDPYSKSKRGSGNYVDCSYLSKWAYQQAGVDIPSTAAAQAKYCSENGYSISKDQLQPGDLVFWTKTGCHCGRWNEIHHVAIYAGNNKIVEAKTSTHGVVVDDLWEGGQWKIAMYARPY